MILFPFATQAIEPVPGALIEEPRVRNIFSFATQAIEPVPGGLIEEPRVRNTNLAV